MRLYTRGIVDDRLAMILLTADVQPPEMVFCSQSSVYDFPTELLLALSLYINKILIKVEDDLRCCIQDINT